MKRKCGVTYEIERIELCGKKMRIQLIKEAAQMILSYSHPGHWPQVQEFGVTEVRDLKPNGRNIPVEEETKMEYIRLVCQMKMTGAIRQQ